MASLYYLLLTVRYLAERARWEAAGRPLRSKERMAEIYDEICEPCDSFADDMCEECGCSVRREGEEMNKLAWATTECPLKKWLKEKGE